MLRAPVESMDLLPPLSARTALLDALGLIIARSGFETFVRAPLLFPDSTYFPEPWEPSERGVRLLSLRLLAYAGLDELDARVELYSNRLQDTSLPIGQHDYQGAAAWFAGIEEEICLFGAETQQLHDGDAIVGVMCHEVAHAYRAYYELESKTRQIDEEHTDITTIYLGFGLLTLNNTHRFRTGAVPGGLLAGSTWSVAQTGYLPIEAMAFLLAAQMVARESNAKERRRVAEALGANQRACFEAACEELGDDVGALRARLGVAPTELWPEETPFELPALPEDAYFVPAAGPERRPFNEGKTVFRVEVSRTARYALGAMTVGMIGSLLLRSPGAALGGAAVGIALGSLVGARRSRFICSDPRCEAVHPSRALERCPRCGGTIRATLHSAKDRLDAEDAIEAGRELDELERELDAREARSNRRGLVGVAALVALLAWGAFMMIVPKRTTIAGLRGNADLIGSYVRIDGDVVEPLDGDGMLNPETRQVLTPFLFADGTDEMHVWCDRGATGAHVAKGAHVRVTGRFEELSVEGKLRTRFIADTVD